MRSDDPSECVLSRWEVSNKSTVGTMYDLLVDCELPDVADHLWGYLTRWHSWIACRNWKRLKHFSIGKGQTW